MTSWIVETLVATTVLMAIVLMIRRPVAARFGARAAYLLWLAPALRMILPPLPGRWFGAQAQPFQEAIVVVTDASSPSAIAPMVTESGISWPMIAVAVWLGGAAVYFLWHWLAYRNFARRILAGAQPLHTPHHIRLAASDRVTSPIAMGIWRRAIIVPDDFETRFDGTEQRLALSHELTHHRRGDLPVNLAALLMLALHWFNPIAHIAHRAFRLDQEAACDAIVLQGATAGERHAYGRALFKAAIGPVPLAICAMGATTTLKARLRQIVCDPHSAVSLRAGATIAGVLIVGGVLFTASSATFAEPTQRAVPLVESAQAIVLGGGIVEAGDGASDRGRAAIEAEVEAAQAKSDQAQANADAASAAADKANDWAKTDREQRKADIARAKADAARARADLAQSAADLARREADAAMRTFKIDIPEPPAPPEVLEAPSAPAAPEAPAKATAVKIKCPEGSQRRVITAVKRTGDAKPRYLQIISCRPDIGQQRQTMLEATTLARATIAEESALTEELRTLTLRALDRQLAELKASRFIAQ